ncbi:phosphomannomutase / phosphoglucomutase [Desulfotomaculum arcticum]|uniref:Phosphomannomutase / phosphoglucomutase n=1 Tax=Desulfotruncus arcticus DSM 17038 TaxID=1121424 RepID=A0A1I2TH96_9FIRM|nr:phosphomannomutase/phosphoglucomutase [Desulfotruncus arcticus]SFG61691.1 phosphomannomutase / phosphoglucomutase [Desulfotomaculum arcticum] [Desulfotruncus arcticus DSM 17038]
MAAINPDIFRQYDIRGVADRDLTPGVVELLGRAFGSYVRAHGSAEVIVGRDNRASSDRLRENLVQGLHAAGCRVIDVGQVVTPMVYYARVHFGVDGAVMITGSHNPPDENGFKISLGAGTIYGEEIQRLREMMEREDFTAGSGAVEQRDIVGPYMAMLQDKIKPGPRRLKVAVDCGNGTAGYFAEQVLQGWGVEVLPLYCEPDPTFPNHQPDPVKTKNLVDLRREVLQRGADLGVAYDGDADRIGVVDDQGEVIWGDKLMCLYWREILPQRPGTPAIIEVKCSQCLEDEVKRLGGQPFFYKTGHSLIKAKMKEVEAVFTGEMSGHMFFADEYYGYDDAFYATGRLLRILSNATEALSGLLAGVPVYYSTAETRVPCADREKFRIVDQLVEKFRNEYDVIDVDGARVLFGDGWGLVRASNTQPVLVARCEASTKEGLDRICAIMKDALTAFPEVSPFDWEY